MTVETTLLAVQTLVQIVGLAAGGYVIVRWQRQTQRQTQHLHVHGGSFDDVEVEERDRT